MFVNTGHQPQTDCPSDGLRHLPLIHRSQTGFVRVLDFSYFSHVLGHEGEVLLMSVKIGQSGSDLDDAYPVMIDWIGFEHVKDVCLRSALDLTFPPFGHLDTAKIVGGVDVSFSPSARHLFLVVRRFSGCF